MHFHDVEAHNFKDVSVSSHGVSDPQLAFCHQLMPSFAGRRTNVFSDEIVVLLLLRLKKGLESSSALYDVAADHAHGAESVRCLDEGTHADAVLIMQLNFSRHCINLHYCLFGFGITIRGLPFFLLRFESDNFDQRIALLLLAILHLEYYLQLAVHPCQLVEVVL